MEAVLLGLALIECHYVGTSTGNSTSTSTMRKSIVGVHFILKSIIMEGGYNNDSIHGIVQFLGNVTPAASSVLRSPVSK